MNFTPASKFCEKFLGKDLKPIQTDFQIFSRFYLVDKYFLKECSEPAFVIYVKAEAGEVKEHLYSEHLENPKLQLKDFEKPYFDEATHLLVSEIIPFDEKEGKAWTQRFASYLKNKFNFTYPVVDPYI